MPRLIPTLALLLLLITTSTCPARSLTMRCIDYRDYLHWVGSAYEGGLAEGIEVAGGYAYLAAS